MKINSEIVGYIRKLSSSRKNLAEEIRGAYPNLVKKINKRNLAELKVCGIDGGLLKKEFQGMTLLVRRAVGVCFTFSEKVHAEYLPSKNPVPEPRIVPPQESTNEVSIISNLRRVECEIETALKCAKKFEPDVLILDGALILHPSSIPNKDSSAYSIYKKVVGLLKSLYDFCSSNEILLVGASEDSRASKFCNIISGKLSEKSGIEVLEHSNDITFLYYLLKKGERTTHFSYSVKGELPGISDLGSWGKKIYAMYIKPVEFDRPLRLDFIAKNPQLVADKISAIVNQLSCQNRTYAYPSVLIEADARAKLSEKEMLMFYQDLKENLGMNPTIFDLRRNRRPI